MRFVSIHPDAIADFRELTGIQPDDAAREQLAALASRARLRFRDGPHRVHRADGFEITVRDVPPFSHRLPAIVAVERG